jgi:hypothetical protein
MVGVGASRAASMSGKAVTVGWNGVPGTGIPRRQEMSECLHMRHCRIG